MCSGSSQLTSDHFSLEIIKHPKNCISYTLYAKSNVQHLSFLQNSNFTKMNYPNYIAIVQ